MRFGSLREFKAVAYSHGGAAYIFGEGFLIFLLGLGQLLIEEVGIGLLGLLDLLLFICSRRGGSRCGSCISHDGGKGCRQSVSAKDEVKW